MSKYCYIQISINLVYVKVISVQKAAPVVFSALEKNRALEKGHRAARFSRNRFWAFNSQKAPPKIREAAFGPIRINRQKSPKNGEKPEKSRKKWSKALKEDYSENYREKGLKSQKTVV